jgi:ABC-type nitrate/sulfonate/bicarbonate transport system substrate-binding protein
MKRLLGCVFAVGLAVLLPGAAALRAQTLETIRLGAGPDDQATPLLWAAKSGLYRRYGLDVEVVKLAGAAAVTAALVGGSLEVGKGSTLTIVTAIAKGVPLTIIGNLSYYEADHPDIAMLVLNSSPIKSAKDFDGKTVASVSLQDLNAIATFSWLERGGVDRSRVKLVEVPQSAVVAAMEQGRIDGASTFEPYLSAALATGKVRIVGYPHDTIARKYSNAVLFTSTKWAESHRDAVQRFLRASEEASTYISGHDAVSNQLIAEFTGMDPASLGNIRHARRGIALNPVTVQPVLDAATRFNIVPSVPPIKEMICPCALLQK